MQVVKQYLSTSTEWAGRHFSNSRLSVEPPLEWKEVVEKQGMQLDTDLPGDSKCFLKKEQAAHFLLYGGS